LAKVANESVGSRLSWCRAGPGGSFERDLVLLDFGPVGNGWRPGPARNHRLLRRNFDVIVGMMRAMAMTEYPALRVM